MSFLCLPRLSLSQLLSLFFLFFFFVYFHDRSRIYTATPIWVIETVERNVQVYWQKNYQKISHITQCPLSLFLIFYLVALRQRLHLLDCKFQLLLKQKRYIVFFCLPRFSAFVIFIFLFLFLRVFNFFQGSGIYVTGRIITVETNV